MNLQTFKIEWAIPEDEQKWLKQHCIGKTLNFPCGQSTIGYRADIDKTVYPDKIANLNNPLKYFTPWSFDTVLCDPPYFFYSKFKWLQDLKKIARKRLILCTPAIWVYLGRKTWKRRIFAISHGKLFMKIYQIFDRTNQPLTIWLDFSNLVQKNGD